MTGRIDQSIDRLDLVAQLERGEGADRALDEALATVFSGWLDSRAGWWAPEYTTSPDATMDALKWRYPTMNYSLMKIGSEFESLVWPKAYSGNLPYQKTRHASPARAVAAALLRAIEAYPPETDSENGASTHT